MPKLVSILPAVTVAVLFTFITSLYINAGRKIEELSQENTALNTELKSQKSILDKNAKKIAELEQRALINELTLKNSSDYTVTNKQSALPPENPEIPLKETEHTATSADLNSIETKISSISKFIQLSDNQTARLRNKFSAELDPGNKETESLDEILGKDNADFYRQQKKAAFSRMLQESIEKEILFVSKKINLNQLQEDTFRKIYNEVEEEIKLKRESEKNSGINTLERLVLEEKLRNKLLAERMKEILSPSQYKEFINYQSGNQEMQLWHEK